MALKGSAVDAAAAEEDLNKVVASTVRDPKRAWLIGSSHANKQEQVLGGACTDEPREKHGGATSFAASLLQTS